MSADLEQVVAQLRATIEQIDTAAVTAMRAQADAGQASSAYVEAGTGSGHPDIRAAQQSSREAGDKAGKMARLLAQAARHFARYANTIAPGSVDPGAAVEAAHLTGETLLEDTVARQGAQKNIASFLGRAARSAEDVQDTTENATDAGVRTIKILSREFWPKGAKSAGTVQDATVTLPGTRTKIDAPETAGNLVIVGVMAGIALHKGVQQARRAIGRLRK